MENLSRQKKKKKKNNNSRGNAEIVRTFSQKVIDFIFEKQWILIGGEGEGKER